MDDILMGVRDARRLGPIEDALKGKITNEQGALRAGVSVRQFRRLKERVARLGPAGLQHGNRGQPSRRRITAQVRARIVFWLRRPEVRVNDCQIAEKLREEEKVEVSHETVRRVRRSEGIAPKRGRRSRRHRRRRERKARFGAMVLTDGSPFRWLADDGPELTLVGTMDDATGRILTLTLHAHEDLHAYATTLHQTFVSYGLPERLYGDRTTVFVRSDDHWTIEEQLAGRRHPTQLGQVIKDLDVTYIAALSPQAKGRIERLWETLQDRLVVEVRLRGITTIKAAHAYLPEFIGDHNRRYALAPRDAESAWRRSPRDLDFILSCRYERMVANDNTVTLEERVVSIPAGPGGRSYAQCKVELRELLDGRLVVLYRGQRLAQLASPPGSFELSPRGGRMRQLVPKIDAHPSPTIDDRVAVRTKTRSVREPKAKFTTRPWRPDAKHPWRRSSKPIPAPVG